MKPGLATGLLAASMLQPEQGTRMPSTSSCRDCLMIRSFNSWEGGREGRKEGRGGEGRGGEGRGGEGRGGEGRGGEGG